MNLVRIGNLNNEALRCTANSHAEVDITIRIARGPDDVPSNANLITLLNGNGMPAALKIERVRESHFSHLLQRLLVECRVGCFQKRGEVNRFCPGVLIATNAGLDSPAFHPRLVVARFLSERRCGERE